MLESFQQFRESKKTLWELYLEMPGLEQEKNKVKKALAGVCHPEVLLVAKFRADQKDLQKAKDDLRKAGIKVLEVERED